MDNEYIKIKKSELEKLLKEINILKQELEKIAYTASG